MSDLDAAALAYLRYVLEYTALSPSALARQAGISPTTLTRPLNNPEHKFSLSMSTIDKIVKATGRSFAPFANNKSEIDIAKDIAQDYLMDPDFYDTTDPIVHVSIVAEAAAGHWRDLNVTDVTKYGSINVKPSLYDPKECFGVIVKGTSINNIANDGDALLCVKIEALQFPMEDGDLVVVERRDTQLRQIEISARRWRKTGDENEFRLDSYDPSWSDKWDLLPKNPTETASIIGVTLYIVRSPTGKFRW